MGKDRRHSTGPNSAVVRRAPRGRLRHERRSRRCAGRVIDTSILKTKRWARESYPHQQLGHEQEQRLRFCCAATLARDSDFVSRTRAATRSRRALSGKASYRFSLTDGLCHHLIAVPAFLRRCAVPKHHRLTASQLQGSFELSRFPALSRIEIASHRTGGEVTVPRTSRPL